MDIRSDAPDCAKTAQKRPELDFRGHGFDYEPIGPSFGSRTLLVRRKLNGRSLRAAVNQTGDSAWWSQESGSRQARRRPHDAKHGQAVCSQPIQATNRIELRTPRMIQK
jgi:hypothetical protein